MEKIKKENPKQAQKQKETTRGLLNIRELTENGILTDNGELVFYRIKPSNLSVLSDAHLSARVYNLMTVLKGFAEIEMLCMSSRENFESNKKHMQRRAQEETNEEIRGMLLAEQNHIDRIQLQTATAREFLIVVRLHGEKLTEVFAYLNRIEKNLQDQGFSARKATADEMKMLLAVYFEQNVTTDVFEDYDGERWIILGD